VPGQLADRSGDWRAWYARLGPAWPELNAKIAAAQKDPRTVEVKDAASWSYLRAEGNPPMFVQSGSAYYLVLDNRDRDDFLNTRPSVQVLLAFNRWLKQHKVDLIFVPVPKLAEVYPDRVLRNAPKDRILAPQMRKFMLQLLDEDVEVVDLLPEFLRAVASDASPVFLRTAEVTPQFNGADYAYLTPEERKQVDASLKLTLSQVRNSAGAPYEGPEDGTVAMIGDSYVHYFSTAISKGTGIEALLSRDINLPVTNRSVGGGTTQSLKEFIRNPEILDVHKVVIWIATSDMFMAGGSWDPVPFPGLTQPSAK